MSKLKLGVSPILLIILFALTACGGGAEGYGSDWVEGESQGAVTDNTPESPIEADEEGTDKAENNEETLINKVYVREPINWGELLVELGITGTRVTESDRDAMLGFELAQDPLIKASRTYQILTRVINAPQVTMTVELSQETEWGVEKGVREIIVRHDRDGFSSLFVQEFPWDATNIEVFNMIREGTSYLFIEMDLGEGVRLYRVTQDNSGLEGEFENVQKMLANGLFWSQGDQGMQLLSREYIEFEGWQVFAERFEEGHTGRIFEYLFYDDDLIAVREITEDWRGNQIIEVHSVEISFGFDAARLDFRNYTLVPDGLQKWAGDILYINTAGMYGEESDPNYWLTELEDNYQEGIYNEEQGEYVDENE